MLCIHLLWLHVCGVTLSSALEVGAGEGRGENSFVGTWENELAIVLVTDRHFLHLGSTLSLSLSLSLCLSLSVSVSLSLSLSLSRSLTLSLFLSLRKEIDEILFICFYVSPFYSLLYLSSLFSLLCCNQWTWRRYKLWKRVCHRPAFVILYWWLHFLLFSVVNVTLTSSHSLDTRKQIVNYRLYSLLTRKQDYYIWLAFFVFKVAYDSPTNGLYKL